VPTVFIAVDLGQGVENAFDDVVAFVPKLLGFLVVLLIGYFVAKAIAKIVDAALDRVGFDSAVERGGIKKALSKSRYDASDILAKVVFYSLFLLVLQLAFGVFGPNPVSELLTAIIAYLPKVIVAIIIVVVAAAIAAAARSLLNDSLGGMSYGPTLANIASGMIVAVGAFAALDQLEIAPAIVNGLFYAVLAVIAGSAIIAIGGGGIQPMRDRWERALTKVEQEAPQARQHMQARRTAARTPEPRPEPPPQPVEPEPVPATEVDHGQGEPEPTSVTDVTDVADVEEVGDGHRETEHLPPPTPVPGRRSGGRREPLRSRSPRNSNGA
jgi:hypothetical protein